MKITAVVDRIENGVAVLAAQEFEAEFQVPEEMVAEEYRRGEVITLVLNNDGECIITQ